MLLLGPVLHSACECVQPTVVVGVLWLWRYKWLQRAGAATLKNQASSAGWTLWQTHCVMRSARAYLWNTLRLVVGQQVVVELRTVKHASERFGRCGERLGCKAVVAGHSWSIAAGFRGLFAGAVDRRLLGEALVRQEVGLNSVLASSVLGCGEDRRGSASEPDAGPAAAGLWRSAVPSGAGLDSATGTREGVVWGTASYFFSTGLGFSTDSGLCQRDKTISPKGN